MPPPWTPSVEETALLLLCPSQAQPRSRESISTPVAKAAPFFRFKSLLPPPKEERSCCAATPVAHPSVPPPALDRDSGSTQ
jgi:hypothetical protein